jgi:hypothetical protein
MSTELAAMIAPWRNAPVPLKVVPAQRAVDAALAAAPGMTVATVAMPGSMFAGGHHYDVFLSGNQPLTSKLIMPVLINAEDGTVSDMRASYPGTPRRCSFRGRCISVTMAVCR